MVFWYGGQLVSRSQMEVQSFFLAYMAIIFGGQGAGFIFGYSSSTSNFLVYSFLFFNRKIK